MVRDNPADLTFAVLVERAKAGDGEAWRVLTGRLKNVAWKTINSFQLGYSDSNDVFAAVFFRLADKLDTIRDPDYLPGWVARTARNEVYSLLRSRRRHVPMAEALEELGDPTDLADGMLHSELNVAVEAAFAHLGDDCKTLLRLLTAEPPIAYKMISEQLGMPVGSIGPTRERCLAKLRARAELQPFLVGGAS